jgi:hypothetical protein
MQTGSLTLFYTLPIPVLGNYQGLHVSFNCDDLFYTNYLTGPVLGAAGVYAYVDGVPIGANFLYYSTTHNVRGPVQMTFCVSLKDVTQSLTFYYNSYANMKLTFPGSLVCYHGLEDGCESP